MIATTSTKTTSTLTTSIENYWMVASPNAIATHRIAHCGNMTHISGYQSLLLSYTVSSPNTMIVKGYNGVTSFSSEYGSVRSISQLPDRQTAILILHEAEHLPWSFKLISPSQMINNDVIVEPVNHYSLNFYNFYRRLTATAQQVNGLFVLDRGQDWAPELSEYPDIDNNSCLVALGKTGDASRHDAEKRMLRQRCFADIGLKYLEILRKVNANSSNMTGKWDCKSCIKCNLARKTLTPNTTSRATEPLLVVHLGIWGPLQTAIGGGWCLLLFINDTTRHTDTFILNYKSEALVKFNEWKALREKESGKQVKWFRTDGGGKYMSKKIAEYLKSEGIVEEPTMPYTPQSNSIAN